MSKEYERQKRRQENVEKMHRKYNRYKELARQDKRNVRHDWLNHPGVREVE